MQANEAGAVTYAGCIGNDEFGATMEAAVKTEGLTTLYKKSDSGLPLLPKPDARHPAPSCLVILNPRVW